jgi:hypothetical protein
MLRSSPPAGAHTTTLLVETCKTDLARRRFRGDL